MTDSHQPWRTICSLGGRSLSTNHANRRPDHADRPSAGVRRISRTLWFL